MKEVAYNTRMRGLWCLKILALFFHCLWSLANKATRQKRRNSMYTNPASHALFQVPAAICRRQERKQRREMAEWSGSRVREGCVRFSNKMGFAFWYFYTEFFLNRLSASEERWAPRDRINHQDQWNTGRHTPAHNIKAQRGEGGMSHEKHFNHTITNPGGETTNEKINWHIKIFKVSL